LTLRFYIFIIVDFTKKVVASQATIPPWFGLKPPWFGLNEKLIAK